MAVVAALIATAGVGLSFPLPGWFRLAGHDADQLRRCFQFGAVAAAANLFNNAFVGFSKAVQNTALMSVVGVAASAASFAVSLCLVLTGWGLWALPLGVMTRAFLALAGSVVFLLRYHKDDMTRRFRWRMSIATELAKILPATALGGLSYSLMNQSDTALVGILLRPELAAVYNITRKAIDTMKALIDNVAFASYGGFAHLVGSAERGRSLQVHAEILSVRLWLAIPAAAVYLAVNEAFLRLWVGPSLFGGRTLTFFLALQMIVGGGSYLINYLYRASVSVQKGSLMLALEAAVRVPLMVALLLWLGLPGLPLGGMLAAFAFGVIVSRWTKTELSHFATPPMHLSARTLVMRTSIVSIGILSCLFAHLGSWHSILLLAFAIGLAGTTLLLYTDDHLEPARLLLKTWVEAARLGAGGRSA